VLLALDSKTSTDFVGGGPCEVVEGGALAILFEEATTFVL
jgi:hypothetical protein